MQSAKIESGLAEFALNEVKRVISIDSANTMEYKSYCKKFPSMVQTNGLAASIAFLKDKGKAYNYLYEHIENRLKELGSLPKDASLIDYVCSLETAQYRVVTKEVLSLFNWLRRFASGLIEGEA